MSFRVLAANLCVCNNLLLAWLVSIPRCRVRQRRGRLGQAAAALEARRGEGCAVQGCSGTDCEGPIHGNLWPSQAVVVGKKEGSSV